MRSRYIARLLLLLFAVALSGCGQKGRLYLPDNPEQAPDTEDSEQLDS